MDIPVIDFHTHPYLSEEEFVNFYPQCFSPSPEQCRTDLERAGIRRICGSVLLKEPYTPERGFSYLQDCNARARKLKELWGDFYVPGIHIHPGFVEQSLEELRLAHDEGIRLVGELVPYLHGWQDYSDRELSRLLDAAGQYHMVVSFHTLPDEQEEMKRMVQEHPDVTFVAAHPNDKAVFLTQLERMEACPNLYLDLSGTGIFRYGAVAYGVSRLGSQRFLFGTDYPICNPRMYVQALYQEPLSQWDRENILYRNAQRLFDLSPLDGGTQRA